MHVIIMGCGRVGVLLASILAGEGHRVAVIDRESQAFSRLGENFNGLMVTGTGIDEDVQRRAGVENADAFVAATRDDNTNIMSAQVAREIFGVPKVIARIYDPERESIYHELGLETMSPVISGAFEIRNAILSGGIKRTPMRLGNLEVIEVDLPSALSGKLVSDIESPGDIRIMALMRDGLALIPVQETELKNGDRVAMVIARESLPRVQSALGFGSA